MTLSPEPPPPGHVETLDDGQWHASARYAFGLGGTIEVLTEWLSIAGADGQILVVYHAVPGSPSEQALLRLAGMTSSGACPSQS